MRIFEVVASTGVLGGLLNDLAPRFGVTADDFLGCLDGLVEAGWVTVEAGADASVRIALRD